MKDAKKNTVGLATLGKIPGAVLKIASDQISEHFNLPAAELAPVKIPESCLDRRRMQYDAGRVIEFLQTLKSPEYCKIIGLLDADIFLPIFTHVFGEAEQGGDYAVISMFRLKNDPGGGPAREDMLYERTAKVLLHEAGHLFGLYHCRDKNCLMHFSGSIETLDSIPMSFCSYCRSYISPAPL